MNIRLTTPGESARVNELFAIAFEQPLENGPAEEEVNPRVHCWGAFDDRGTMMSTLTISDFSVRFDNSACKMGGIGGVATLPAFRRQGGIRGIFETVLPRMYAENYGFSYLYPFSTAYYRKFGYEACVQRLEVTVDLGLLKPQPVPGFFRLAEKDCPMTDSIRQLDQVWEQQYNMMVLHQEEDYRWTLEPNPARTQEFTYVCFDRDETPLAYTTFRMVMEPDGRNLRCSRFLFRSAQGFQLLMQLFKSLSADHALVKFVVPDVYAMQYLLPEWSMGAARWSVTTASMVRVINVRRCLEQAACRGTGSVTIQVNDPQIPQNNHCYTLDFAPGRPNAVTLDQREPDAVLEISTFSALLAGVCSFSEAEAFLPGMQVLQTCPALARVFFKKPLMITDYF